MTEYAAAIIKHYSTAHYPNFVIAIDRGIHSMDMLAKLADMQPREFRRCLTVEGRLFAHRP